MELTQLPANAVEFNSSMWRNLYSEGKNDLRYPNEVLVRLGAQLFDPSCDRRIFDFGFGTGANLLHFAERGFDMHGVEVSEHALSITKQRLTARGRSADLRLVAAGERLPFDDSFFNVTYAWHVIYYNDVAGWRATVCELERITAPGGLIIVATAAPGDVAQADGEPLGNHMYKSRAANQVGCIVTVPDRRSLRRLFPGRRLQIGEFGFRFGPTRTRQWIVCYRMPEK
jgi:SAM-dependent methyltransferase